MFSSISALKCRRKYLMGGDKTQTKNERTHSGKQLRCMGGEMESSSQVSSMRKKALRRCHCGEEAVLRTSWTDENPGRRFYGCVEGKRGCNFFVWHDEEIPEREKKIMKKLLKKVDLLEERQKFYVIGLCFSSAMVVMLLVLMLKVIG